jgi:hypothetical protein
MRPPARRTLPFLAAMGILAAAGRICAGRPAIATTPIAAEE